MAVSIPHLNRIEPDDTMPQNDRINMRVRDQASNILGRTEEIESLGNKGMDIFQQAENDTIDTVSSTVESDYTSWNNAELEKLKKIKGDPTVHYAQYEERAKQKREDILKQYSNVSDRVKRHTTSRFDKVVGNQSIVANKQRGAQQETWENDSFEAAVKLKKDSLPVNAGYVQVGDASSYSMFEDGMREIKTLISKRGLKQGTVTRLPDDAEKYSHSFVDDDGKTVKVSMTDVAKQRTAKELSEGVKNSIDVLIASGQMDAARDMQEKYKGYIDPVSQVKIDKKFETAGRKDEAYKFVAGLRGKASGDQMATIDSIQDPELRSEVLKIKDADDRRIESMRDRKAKRNYETLATKVLERQNSDQPFHGLADLENDPLYKQTWDNLNPKQKKAVVEMVSAPKESNPKSELRMQNLFLGSGDKQIETMTPEEFAEETVGLSKASKTKYTNLFMSLRVQTEGEKRAMYTQAGNMLRDQLLADGHIKRNDYNKIAGDDEITLIKANEKLMQHLASQTGTFRPEQLQKFVKDFSAAEIKGKVFNPQPKSVLKPKSDTTSRTPDVKVSGDEMIKLKRKYRSEKGKFPSPNDTDFLEYVKRNAGKS